jgi:hydroxyacylglutathione hydrolase
MNEIEIFPVCAFNDNYIWTLRQGRQGGSSRSGDAAPVLDYLRAENLSSRQSSTPIITPTTSRGNTSC